MPFQLNINQVVRVILIDGATLDDANFQTAILIILYSIAMSVGPVIGKLLCRHATLHLCINLPTHQAVSWSITRFVGSLASIYPAASCPSFWALYASAASSKVPNPLHALIMPSPPPPVLLSRTMTLNQRAVKPLGKNWLDSIGLVWCCS